jgi:hypothetical protein
MSTTIRISINTIAKKSPPSSIDKTCKAPTLSDKIEYALGLIEAGASNRLEAIDFLQKVYHTIQKKHPYTVEDSDLMAKLTAVFSTYGIKFKNSKD